MTETEALVRFAVTLQAWRDGEVSTEELARDAVRWQRWPTDVTSPRPVQEVGP